MMKLKGTFRGREMVVLGLSHANLDRLRADGLSGYIQISGDELGIAFDILITAAENERVMLEAFADGIVAGTILRISDKLKQ